MSNLSNNVFIAVACQSGSMSVAARTLACIADVLGAMAGEKAGLRSGPAQNIAWKESFSTARGKVRTRGATLRAILLHWVNCRSACDMASNTNCMPAILRTLLQGVSVPAFNAKASCRLVNSKTSKVICFQNKKIKDGVKAMALERSRWMDRYCIIQLYYVPSHIITSSRIITYHHVSSRIITYHPRIIHVSSRIITSMSSYITSMSSHITYLHVSSHIIEYHHVDVITHHISSRIITHRVSSRRCHHTSHIFTYHHNHRVSSRRCHHTSHIFTYHHTSSRIITSMSSHITYLHVSSHIIAYHHVDVITHHISSRIITHHRVSSRRCHHTSHIFTNNFISVSIHHVQTRFADQSSPPL